MPRSPSRDLSDRYTGRRGYFRTPYWIHRWKYILAAVAFTAACGWAAVDVLQPTRGAYAHTHGPLANPHAAFDENCAACHVAHSASEFSVRGVFDARDRWHTFTCGKCHAGADRADFGHHASANEKAKAFHERCSNCHHDHLGRLNSLVRLSDKDCTQCHSNLGAWHDAAKSKAGTPYQNAVTDFVKEHPDFRSLNVEQKPRTLTFSHAVHMNPGQAYTPGGKEAMTVGHLRKLGGDSAVQRYAPAGAKDDHVVQLNCASCHKLDAGAGTAEYDRLKESLARSGEPTKSLLPPRQAGAYFLPVNFEAHCSSCHPLTAPAGTRPVGKGEQEVVPHFDVPHRRQVADLRADLKAAYLRQMIAEKNPLLAKPPEPGGKIDAPDAAARALGAEADRLALAAERALFDFDKKEGMLSTGCAKCHATTGKDKDLRIAPVPDRTVWFTHAKFNHAAHRGATCATCHPGTSAAVTSPPEAAKPEPVQILGVDSCRACHSPAGTKVKQKDGTELVGGGIRHSCTDCHNYHHGDLPQQGRGAQMRFPKEPRDLADWLKGK